MVRTARTSFLWSPSITPRDARNSPSGGAPKRRASSEYHPSRRRSSSATSGEGLTDLSSSEWLGREFFPNVDAPFLSVPSMRGTLHSPAKLDISFRLRSTGRSKKQPTLLRKGHSSRGARSCRKPQRLAMALRPPDALKGGAPKGERAGDAVPSVRASTVSSASEASSDAVAFASVPSVRDSPSSPVAVGS